jgi:hypothetical protein
VVRGNISKIIGYSGWGVAFVLLALLVRVEFEDDRDWGEAAGRAEQLVQLSNDSSLRIQQGPSDPDTMWRILYLPQARGQSAVLSTLPWEHAGWWLNGGGDILACPMGNVVLVALTRGEWVFIRTAAGRWTSFYMEIDAQHPFLPDGAGGAAMGVGEIQELRKRMAVEPTENSVRPQLAQFQPERRELWVDYLTSKQRRFRVRLRLSDNAEKFQLVNVDEQAYDPHRGWDQFDPDIPLDPICDRIQFAHRKR